MWKRLPGPRAIAGALGRAGRRALPYLAAAGGVAAVGAGGWAGYQWMMSSPRFAVASIDIDGNRLASEERLRARMPVSEGDNIFQLDLGELEAAIGADPWVAEVTVRRQLPDRVVIGVVEHQPAALVELSGLYLADADGAVFKRASFAAGDGLDGDGMLPIITGLSRDDYLDDPEGTGERVRAALAALEMYRAGAGRPEVGELHLDVRRGLTFVTVETATAIRIGDPRLDTLAQRLGVFDAAWDALDPDEREAARVIHADNTTRPDRVTVAFAEQVDN